MIHEYFIEKNYKMEIAGRVWNIPEVKIVKDFRGHPSIAVKDLISFQMAVANYICAEDCAITLAEFELLCSLSQLSASDVANALRIDKSTISKWRKNKEKNLPYTDSLVFKQIVWQRLFPDIGRRINDRSKQREFINKEAHLPEISLAA